MVGSYNYKLFILSTASDTPCPTPTHMVASRVAIMSRAGVSRKFVGRRLGPTGRRADVKPKPAQHFITDEARDKIGF